MNKSYLIIIIFIISKSVFSQENWTIYNTSNSDLTFDIISDIEFDSEGNKWIASWYNNGGAGIAKFDNSDWTIFSTNNSQGTFEIHRVEFTTGDLQNWVSVYATTIVHLSDGTETTINSSHDSSTNKLSIDIPVNATDFQIEYYIEDSSTVDMVFVNSNTNEIVHQETFSEQMDFNYEYTFFTNIQSNQIIDITIDNEDNKWLGTWQNGIIKFDDTDWINFTTSNSDLPSNHIKSIANDNNNNIWIGTSSGLTKFDGISWTNYNTTNSDLPSDIIVSIAVDNNDHIWITTANELVEFTGSIWNVYDNNSIGNWFGGSNSLRIDSNNKKWFSAGYGLQSFDGTNWEYFNYLGTNNDCLLDCQTTSLAIDVNDNIWIGAQQECNIGGLLNFSECNSYLTSNSDLPENNILSLNIDNNGTKWIGTFNGLVKLDDQSLSTNDINSDLSIEFYPNPINNFINLRIQNRLINGMFSIVEINGKIIKRGKLHTNLNTINLEGLSKGIYFLKIEKDDLTEIIKIIK